MGRTVPSFRIAAEIERTNGSNLDHYWTRRTGRCLIQLDLLKQIGALSFTDTSTKV